MFPYYGRKKRLVARGFYPEPKYKLIIEPFAGSAAYAMKYWEKDVVLYEQDARIVALWKWLQKSRRRDILCLPVLGPNETLYQYKMPQEAMDLVGYHIARGSSRPNRTPGMFNGWNDARKKQIADDLDKIKHWKIVHGNGMTARNRKATWFVDPPYQFGGHRYRCNKVDYPKLKCFAQSRSGQTIVCENTKADWAKFRPLVEQRGVMFTTTEACWLPDRGA